MNKRLHQYSVSKAIGQKHQRKSKFSYEIKEHENRTIPNIGFSYSSRVYSSKQTFPPIHYIATNKHFNEFCRT